MPITMIAAVARNGVIGADNNLPWRLPADMAFFKAQTMGKPVLMGSKTFRSLKRPLAGRTNVILSRSMTEAPPGCVLVRSIAEALERYRDQPLMVIGGADVYRQMLPYADRLLLTEVEAEVEGDAFFPEFDRRKWRLISRTPVAPDEKHAFAFAFCEYERADSREGAKEE
ncbi:MULTISPECIES: dihydrofolate reductase [Cohnella]|uniref:dihydrofolate reductase n=1 Tax=Cohnella TaxID=329857 RepID=UPI00036D60A9|nr:MULTISPECIES: dihydrofolate reductase [Cohnella]REK68721.1 MAG: dihydrofolate reductase [Cohnella sp.]